MIIFFCCEVVGFFPFPFPLHICFYISFSFFVHAGEGQNNFPQEHIFFVFVPTHEERILEETSKKNQFCFAVLVFHKNRFLKSVLVENKNSIFHKNRFFSFFSPLMRKESWKKPLKKTWQRTCIFRVCRRRVEF